MKKQIIGTGISGLVGSRIVELLGKDYEFINFGLETGVDITKTSLLREEMEKFPQAEAILHLAAFTDVNKCWEEKNSKSGACYQVNVQGSNNIVQLASELKKYLIHISTDFVFNGQQKKGKFYTEKDKPDSIEWYGYTKYLAEKAVKHSQVKASILRIAFPFKAKPAKSSLEPKVKLDLVRSIKEKLEDNKEVTLFSDQIITPTFIDDISEAVGAALKKQPEGIFHCVGSESLSPWELGVKIAKTFGLNKKLVKKTSLKDYLKKKDVRPRQKNMALSNKKIKEELGVEMKTVDQALKEIKKQLDK
jgi:dTDP-4-dehydrorhamnose reductase